MSTCFYLVNLNFEFGCPVRCLGHVVLSHLGDPIFKPLGVCHSIPTLCSLYFISACI